MGQTLTNINVIISDPLEAQFQDTYAVNYNLAMGKFDDEITTATKAKNWADLVLTRPVFKDYAETLPSTVTISSGAATIDFVDGNHVEIDMSENLTTLTVSNPPATGIVGTMIINLKQSGAGSFLLTSPSSFDWGAVGEPVLSTASGSSDRIAIRTRDAGATYEATLSGSGFTTV